MFCAQLLERCCRSCGPTCTLWLIRSSNVCCCGPPSSETLCPTSFALRQCMCQLNCPGVVRVHQVMRLPVHLPNPKQSYNVTPEITAIGTFCADRYDRVVPNDHELKLTLPECSQHRECISLVLDRLVHLSLPAERGPGGSASPRRAPPPSESTISSCSPFDPADAIG